MIPYDDLVAALTAWRARQGLPVAQAVAQPPAAAPSPPPARKPTPPRPAASRAAPAAAVGDFEDGALIEDASYEASGDDYVMQLGGVEPSVEPTAISGAPEPPGKRGKRDRW